MRPSYTATRARLTAAARQHLTRDEITIVMETPRKVGVIKELAARFKVSTALIKHVRYGRRSGGI